MRSRPRSPTADPAPGRSAQPAKRPRCHAPDDLDLPGPPSSPQQPAAAPDAGPQVSLLLVAAGWALSHGDLVLEPRPGRLLRVCVPGHTLLLVSQETLAGWAHLRAAAPEAGGTLGALQLGPFPAAALPLPLAAAAAVAPTLTFPQHLRLQLVPLERDPAARWGDGLHPSPQLSPWAPTLSPHGSPAGPCFSLRLHLLQARLDSALQPLPESPRAGTQKRPKPLPGRRHCKARRRLFSQ
ncbi:proline-rich protein 23A-like [Sorex fumeus]|uniref:proline-rich protein 23A-like n=1 Tax=Sorex fumeus TaxID=62283 RepID=UPI0024AE6D01|nr:proline-rich protein 23A-like [Sorex fumeus]